MNILFWIFLVSLAQAPPDPPPEGDKAALLAGVDLSLFPPRLPRSLLGDLYPEELGTKFPDERQEAGPASLERSPSPFWTLRFGEAGSQRSNAPGWDPGLIPPPPARAPEPRSSGKDPRVEDSPHESLTGFLDSHFSSSAWRENVWRDYLTEPPVLFPLTLAAGAAAVSPWDHTWSQHFQGKMGGNSWIADDTSTALTVGAVFLGIFFPGEGRSWWDELWNEAESFGIANATTSVIKVLVHRHRPGPGGRNQSFPSGHATNAFTAAALIDHNSGSLMGWPAYGIATVTGLSRIDTGDHFPSDVLAGAAIGIFTVGILDALHFGTGREGRGICGPPVDLEMGLGHGGVDLSLGLSLRF